MKALVDLGHAIARVTADRANIRLTLINPCTEDAFAESADAVMTTEAAQTLIETLQRAVDSRSKLRTV